MDVITCQAAKGRRDADGIGLVQKDRGVVHSDEVRNRQTLIVNPEVITKGGLGSNFVGTA